MIASGQGALSALKTGCAGLVVALVLAVMLGQGVRTPVHACCYDPPENDSASDQASTPPTAEDAAPSAPAPSGDISARSDSSADSDSDSSSPAPRFAMISQMMADHEGHTSFGLSADRYRNTDTISYFIDINRSLLGHKDIRFDTHLKQLFTGGASGGRPEYAINSVVRLPL